MDVNAAKKRRLEQLKHDPLLGSPEIPTSSAPAGTAPVPTQNAASLLKLIREGPRLSSGSAQFDSLIVSCDADRVGGLSPGRLLELSGCPGEGKTRTCMSYAIQACLGSDEDDKALRALIIDTQGGMSLGVLLQAAMAANDDDEELAMLCLERMAVWDCYETDDLLVALHALKSFRDQNPSLQIVLMDTLSTHFNANVVPSLSAESMTDCDKADLKYKNGRTNDNKRPRKPYFAADPRQEANYSIIRHFMSGLLKETLLAVTANNVAVVVTTRSKTKLTDDFGERTASVRDAKHSFAVPQFFNHWYIPLATQVILSAAGDGTRTAMAVVTPSSSRGHQIPFRTTVGSCHLIHQQKSHDADAHAILKNKGIEDV